MERQKKSVALGSMVLLVLVIVVVGGAWVATRGRAAEAKRKKVSVEKIDHLMIAVKSLKDATALYSGLFNTEFYQVDPLALGKWGVGSAALDVTGMELVEASAPEGETAKFIARSGETVLGVAFKTPDLDEAIAGMQARRIRLIAKAENATRREALFHPDDAFGVMIKLVEYAPEYSVENLDIVTAWRQARKLTPKPTSASAGSKMKVERVDRALVYVKNLDAAMKFFADLFGSRFIEPKAGSAGASRVSAEGLGLELAEPGSPQSDLHKFFEKRKAPGASGEGAGAMVLKVTNFEDAFATLEAAGIRPITKLNLANRKVSLFARGGGLGIAVGIVEYQPFAHPLACLEMKALLNRKKKK